MLSDLTFSKNHLRISAVSFLNTVPLVWGLLHGRQRGLFDVSFNVPSECADRLAAGTADIGVVPAIEAARIGLVRVADCGIACRGAVRSLLLISKVPFDRIRTVATDSNSRSTVAYTRIILAHRYSVTPAFVAHPPALEPMLAAADAALLIGDPALRVEPAELPYRTLDLGVEWMELTGLPMVTAVWGARPACAASGLAEAFADSLRFGREHMDEIVAREAAGRDFPPAFVRDYLERNVLFDLGENELRGLNRFLAYAREFGILEASGK